mgnify:CR=1 FL=1
MATYSIQIDNQFRFTGQDGVSTHTNAEYPNMSGYLGDVFAFTFFQSEIYAFTIENTDFENKYDNSYFGDGTSDSWIPSVTGVYEYSNPTDFETFGSITILSADTTTTTSTTVDPSAPTTTSTTTTAAPDKIFNVRVAYNLNDEGNRFYINDVANPALDIVEGKFYRFDVSEASNSPHPFRFSLTSDGTHNGGSEYTETVTYNNSFIDLIAPSEKLYYYCSNHPNMGNAINIIPSSTPTTTTPCPLDNCGCGSLSFPSSGTLTINGTDYTLLHRNAVAVGQGQKFITAVERIPSGTPIYVNSLSLDMSSPTCVSHNIELTVTAINDLKFNPRTYKSEKEYNTISLLNVGIPSGTFYIDKPLVFKNINSNIDLQDKIVTLTSQSICNYEAAEPCCDKLPSTLTAQYAIEDLKVTYVPTTTTTSTTTTPAPRSYIDNLVSDAEPLSDIEFEYVSSYDTGLVDFYMRSIIPSDDINLSEFWSVVWAKGVGIPRIPPQDGQLLLWKGEQQDGGQGWLSYIDLPPILLNYFAIAASEIDPGSPDTWDTKLLYGIDANMTEEGPDGDPNYGGDIDPTEHDGKTFWDMDAIFGVGKTKYFMPDYASYLNKKISFYVNDETLDKLRAGHEINFVLDFVEKDYSEIDPFDNDPGGYYDANPAKKDFDLYQYIEGNQLFSDRYGYSVVISFRGNPDNTDKFEVEPVGDRYKISRVFTALDSDGRGTGNDGDTIPTSHYSLIRPFNHLEAGTKIVGIPFGRTHIFPPMYPAKEIPIGAMTVDDLTLYRANQLTSIFNNHVKTERHKLDSDINSENYIPTQYGYSWPIGASSPDRRFFSIDQTKQQIIDGDKNYPFDFPATAQNYFWSSHPDAAGQSIIGGTVNTYMKFYNQVGFDQPFWRSDLAPYSVNFTIPYRYKTIIVPPTSLGSENQRLEYFRDFNNFSSHGYSSLEFSWIGYEVRAVVPLNKITNGSFEPIIPIHPNEDFRPEE